MKFKNMCPHGLDIVDLEGKPAHLPKGEQIVRLEPRRESLGAIEMDGRLFHIVRTTLGEPVGLPERDPNVILVVSAVVAEAATDRDDLACPGAPIRNAEGTIIGADGWAAGPGLAARLRAAQPWNGAVGVND